MKSLMLMCALSMFAIVQGQMFDRNNMQNYYKCWTYMNCISDGPMARRMETCLYLLKPVMKNTRIAQGFEFVNDIHYPPVTNICPIIKILDNTSAVRENPYLTE
ncbi:hypothetical protein AVEN_134135-1 [Araneus ventricosus]|uniref:Seminal fluid protein n=1 Tax=Araneus ventricosus TaxID=182803 RepID=A0A4Y2JHU2_ARAVE|nr:hypothetical protein AVEN_134135-1 [Araneus ventricosus]